MKKSENNLDLFYFVIMFMVYVIGEKKKKKRGKLIPLYFNLMFTYHMNDTFNFDLNQFIV